MFWWLIALEAAAFAVLFTAVIFAYYRGDRKYRPASRRPLCCDVTHSLLMKSR